MPNTLIDQWRFRRSLGNVTRILEFWTSRISEECLQKYSNWWFLDFEKIFCWIETINSGGIWEKYFSNPIGPKTSFWFREIDKTLMITTIAGWATKLRLIYEWLLQAFGKEHFCQNLSFLSMNLSPSCIACYGLIRDGLIYTDLKFLFLAGEKPSSSPTNDRIIYHISRFDLARKYSRPREFCYDI